MWTNCWNYVSISLSLIIVSLRSIGSPRYVAQYDRMQLLCLPALVTSREMARVILAAKLLKAPGSIPSLENRITRTPATIRGYHKRTFLLSIPKSALEERNPIRAIQNSSNRSQHLHLLDLRLTMQAIKLNLKKTF